jgi:polyhydroxyalkanoate synthase subunit PhaC
VTSVFTALDAMRVVAGAWFQAAGLGAVETPARCLQRGPSHQVLAHNGAATDGGRPRPVVLIVPAPIKSSAIWDLAPGVSTVRRLLGAGLQVHLLRWTEPREGDLGLWYYADRALDEAVAAVQSVTGAHRVVLVGHSLGGTLAAIFAALHPARVRGLVLLESPVSFGVGGTGAFAGLLATGVPARVVTAGQASVPGTVLDVVSAAVQGGREGATTRAGRRGC